MQFTKECPLRGCGQVFQTPYSRQRYCDEHAGRKQPVINVATQRRVARVVTTTVAPGQSFRVQQVWDRARDLTPQTITRILDRMVEKGVIAVDDSGARRRFLRVADHVDLELADGTTA